MKTENWTYFGFILVMMSSAAWAILYDPIQLIILWFFLIGVGLFIDADYWLN
jgi:hypothetical protein